MRFSEHFGITQSADDDWFDPHLTVDTKLFVDPLLLLEAGGEWASAHEQLIAHFVHCYGLVAKATSSTSVSAQAARRLLTFPSRSKLVGLYRKRNEWLWVRGSLRGDDG